MVRAVAWGLVALVLAFGVQAQQVIAVATPQGIRLQFQATPKAAALPAAARATSEQPYDLAFNKRMVKALLVEPVPMAKPTPVITSAVRIHPAALPAQKPKKHQAVSTAKDRHFGRFDSLIRREATANNLDPALIHAVIAVESAFRPKVVSSAGAQGLMQLMPATAKRFKVSDPFDPAENIRGGAVYLRWLLDYFADQDDPLILALAGYNAGEKAVVRYGYQVPPYRETQNYVIKVREALDTD